MISTSKQPKNKEFGDTGDTLCKMSSKKNIEERINKLFEKKFSYNFTETDINVDIFKTPHVSFHGNDTKSSNGNKSNESIHGNSIQDSCNDNLNWKIPEYMDMKEEINSLKSSLNDKDVIEWHIHTKKVNPAKKIQGSAVWNYGAEFCTNAWLKFYETASNYLHIDSNMPYFSVHLCEAPGAFITSLHHYLYSTGYKGDWRWLATTLNTYYEGNNIGQMIEDDRLIRCTYDNWYFGVNGTGNIMSRENMEGMKEMLSEIHVNLVTADGSIDCQREPAEQESIVSWLHHCEALAALQILAPGGVFVLKMFTMFECTSVSLMYLLNCLFNKVHVYKPCCSKAGNSEVYVVCINYKGRQLYETFLNSIMPFYFGDRKPTGCLFAQSEIPESFFKEHTSCMEYFQEHQKAAIKRNLDLHKDLDEGEMETLTLEQDLCEETFFDKYLVKHMSRAKKMLVKGNAFRKKKRKSPNETWESEYTKRVKLDGRLTGSLLERQQDEMLSWQHKVMTFETYENEIEKESSFSQWIVNKETSLQEMEIDHLEPVTGLEISDIQNSPFCHGRLVGQVREIIQNVEWLTRKVDRNPEILQNTFQKLKHTIESHYDDASQTFIGAEETTCGDTDKTGEIHHDKDTGLRKHTWENNEVLNATEVADSNKAGETPGKDTALPKHLSENTNEFSETGVTPNSEADSNATRETPDKDAALEKHISDGFTETGVTVYNKPVSETVINEDKTNCVGNANEDSDTPREMLDSEIPDNTRTESKKKQHVDKNEKVPDSESEKTGNGGLQILECDKDMSIGQVWGHGRCSLTECLSNTAMKTKVHLYPCVSETVARQFELCDQQKLLQAVIQVFKKCSVGDLVVMEMGTCLTRISASLVYFLYKCFDKIGFLHHHGNYMKCHLVCVSLKSHATLLVEYLQSVYDTMCSDQSEAVLEIVPVLTILREEKFCDFLQTVNIRLLQSFITTVIEEEKGRPGV